MKQKIELNTLIKRYPKLVCCEEDINKACNILKKTYKNNKKLLIVGNGGSAADSEHIMGELMKSFQKDRKISKFLQDELVKIDKRIGKRLSEDLEKPIKAISLVSHISLSTAFINDKNSDSVYAQQLLGFGEKGDCLLAISCSGNSNNIYNTCVLAKALGIKIIGLTGRKESKVSKISDICIRVPEDETYKIQELHLPIYHYLCMVLEEMFG